MKRDPKLKAEQGSERSGKGRRAASTSAPGKGKHPAVPYEHAPIGIVEASLEGNYISANEEFCRMTGYDREELLGYTIRDFTHEDDYAIDVMLHEKLVAGRIPFYRLEKRYLCKDGGDIWVELTRSLVRDSKGEPLYTVGVVLDISDRKDVERVLRESVERLRLATEAAQMFMWEWDFSHTMYTLADNFEQVIGFSGGLLPKNHYESLGTLIPLDDVQQIARAYEKAVESRSDLHALACRVINPENGQTVWLEVSAKIVYDAEGSPVRMFGVAQNITQSKEAQDEIASISRFPAEDPNPVMRLTPDGKILYGNPGSAPLLAAWQQPADIPYELQAAITQAFSTGAKTEVEIEHDGTTFSCTLAPILGAGYVNLYAKDTTERKQAERKLRESEERFRALVSQATAGIAQSDLNSSLVFVNPRFCEMLGYAEEEILGKTIWELTYTEDVEENQRLFTRMLNDGESYHFEKRFIRKDGSHLWTDVSVSTIRDLDGKAKGGVGVIIEIEDRKQAEAALKGFAREQAALYRLADQLHRTTSFEDIYNSALDAIISALECDRASILLYDDTDVMRFVAWRGLADAYRQATDGHSPWTPEVVNPAPIAMDNVDTADLSDSLRTIIKGEGIVSLAFIPLVSNGRLIGKFMVYFDEPHPFSEDDLDLSLTIARQLAFAIDRKRGEESLRTSEERFRQAADASGALIYEVDPNSGTTAIVYGMERLVGYDPEQALISSDRWRSLVHPEDLPVYLAQLEDHLKKGGTNVSEYRLHHKNGDWIIVQDNRMLVSDETGQPVRLIGAVIDITERKRIEEALRIENERFMRFVDSNIVGILIGKDDGEVVLANDYYLRLLGVTREDLMAGKVDWQKFTPREWLPADEKAIEELREYGICEPYEKEYVRSDGTLIPVYIANAMLPGPGEEIASFVIDITERKRAEEALRKSEERYRGIVNQSVGGISETDLTGKYIMVNDHYCEITGYTRRELLNEMRMQDITHPDDLAKNSELFARLAADGTSFEIEKRYVRPDGSIVWVHNSVSAITRIDGRPQSAVAVVIDVTERKRAEETMRRNEELFSTLVEAAPFGVYFIDSEFRLRAINKGSENVFKGIYPLMGRDFAEILRIVWQEPFATESIERFRHTLRTGESFLSPPVIEPRANINEIQSYDWQIHRITMPDGTYGVVCYFYDLSEQKRMEATVRASEALYRAIAGSIPGGGVYVVDKDFRYLVAEGPVTDAFGLSRKMLEGHAVTEVFPDARGERMEERLRRTFAGETISFETKHNGRVYWTRQAPLLDSIGQAIILTLDITERKQAEEALRESEERFRAILRQATAGIVRKDAEGRLIFVNQAFCNMLGYTEAELLGKPIWDLMYEEDIAENKRSYDRMMVEGVPFKLERRLLREDGSMIWVDGSVSPIMDAEGRPQTSVAVEVDITGRKQAEEALHQLNLQLEERVLHRTAKLRAVNQTLREEITERKRIEEALRKSEAIAHENEAKLRSLFELLPVGISFLDLEGRVIQMNSALLNILKSSKEEFLGHTHKTRRYIRTDGTPMLPAEFASARAIAEKHTVYNVETGIVIESGEVIWTSVSAAPVDVADVSVVVVTVDITDNKRAEQALHESHARLRILSQRLVEVQEEERRALARELHDRVGQTLAALNINLIIINSQLSGEVTEHIGTRLNDSMKLVAETIALVRDVMTDLRPAVLDDYGLEAALEAHLSKFIARYDIDTRFEKPAKPLPRLGPSIEMTLLRIAQEALMNIARHAQATQVSLSVQQEPDAICMTIQDNGIGIQSWQEANRPGSHGMTIMRERAEAFGGNLRVRSVPGQGTKIEAVIPLRDRRETGQENNV